MPNTDCLGERNLLVAIRGDDFVLHCVDSVFEHAIEIERVRRVGAVRNVEGHILNRSAHGPHDWCKWKADTTFTVRLFEMLGLTFTRGTSTTDTGDIDDNDREI